MDLLSWDHHEEHENQEPAPDISSSGSETSVISKSKKAGGRTRDKAANGDIDAVSGPQSPPPRRFGGQLAAVLPVLSDIAELYEASQAHKRANQEAIQHLLAQIHDLQRQLIQPLQNAGPSGSTSDLEATVAGQVNKLDKQVKELSREYDRLHRVIESREGQLHNLHVLEHTNKQIYAAIVVAPSPDAQRLDAHRRSDDQTDTQAATTSTPTLPAIQRKPHRGPSAYVSRARSASPRHGAPSPLSRSAEWATPRSGSPGVHGSRSVDFGRSSRQPARGRSHTSLGHARAHEPRAAGGREPKSARASLTQAKDAHHAASTNGGVSSVHSKGGGAGAEDGEEDEGEAEDLDWDVAPEQASMLREAYMAGLLADTRAFVAGRREVLAVGKTFLYVAARLEKDRVGLNPTVQGAQAALRQAHEETLKMLATYKEAEHARELASGALRLAQAQLERRRKDWARRLVEKDQVNQLKGDVRALLKSREQQRKAIQAKAQGRREQEAKAKAQALARALGAAAGPGGGERVDAEGEKLSKRFSMMMAASGCKNLRDLVHKVCTQTDTHVHLQVDAEEGKAKVAALREEAARLQSQLRDLHFVEAGMLDNRKKIDLAGEALAAAERKAADATLRCERAFQVLASSRTGIEHLALQLGLPKLPDPKPAQPRASLATTRPLSPHSPQSPTAHAAPAEHADADVSVAVLAVCEEKEAALLAAIADAAARPAPGKAPPPAAPAKGAASILSRAPRAQSLTKEPSMDRTAHAAAEPAPRISNRALMSRERGLDQWPATSEADAAAHHVERVDERDAASTRRESEWRPEDGGGAAGEEGWREGLHVRVVEPGKGGGKKAKGGRKDAMSAMAKVLQMQTVSRLWLGDARLSAHDGAGAAHTDGAGHSSSDEEQDGHSGRGSFVRSRSHSEVESRPPRPPGKGNARTSNFHAPRRKAPLPPKGGSISEAPDPDDLLQPVRTREDIKREAAARMLRTHDAREPVCVG